MLLTSYPFLFFLLPVTLFIYFVFFENKKHYKLIYLGAISAYFYFIDNGILLLILIFLTLVTKFQIDKKFFNNYLFVSLILFPLIVFKYSYTFFEFYGLPTPDYIENNFPIGLSFFTFQAIAYYFDSNRNKNNESSFEIFTFLAFFPQLLAGPIVDINTFRNGMGKSATQQEIIMGVHRISIGLLKKFLIADTLSEVTLIFSNTHEIINLSFLSSLIIILSYTFQIYYDFSGYCDIAIGLGMFFGFKLPENFTKPYTSKSFKEFWQKWHITLSNFFKNYVYIPLGGSKTTTLKTYRNLWITFLCTALWHGSSLPFLLWGFLHGFFMTIERLLNFSKVFSNRFITFTLIALSWVPFFSKDLSDVRTIYFGLLNFNFNDDYLLPLIVQNINFKFLVVSIICVLSLNTWKYKFNPNFWSSYALLLFAIVVVISSSVDPFIYFKF
jgi:alginate O-acetyltransferase complex protein AlgI